MASARMTRARTAKVGEQLHVDEDALLGLQSDRTCTEELKAALAEQEHGQRKALGEVDANSVDSSLADLQVESEGKTCGKNGRQNAAEDRKDQVDTWSGAGLGTGDAEQTDKANSPERNVSASDASAATPQEATMGFPNSTSSKRGGDILPEALPGSATQSQSKTGNHDPASVDAKMHSPSISYDGGASRDAKVNDLPAIRISKRQQGQGEDANGSITQNSDDSVTLHKTPATPSAVSRLKIDTPGKRSTSNKENIEPTVSTPLSVRRMETLVRDNNSNIRPSYDALEAAAVGAATSPGVATPTNQLSRPQSPAQESIQDSSTALDLVEEAVEEGNQKTPEVPPKPETTTVNAEQVSFTRVKKAPVVRTTKAAQARISLAHGPPNAPRPPALGRPRESSGSSLRHSVGGGQRVTSTSSIASASSESKQSKDVIIPHSKPRPMSMSFPAPPPPPKSTKAPTKSTFQLPGEAVAAKLKAAREERSKKDDGKKAFKARPAPVALKRAPSVRQTNTSRARESIGVGRDALSGSASNTLKRASSVATSRPSLARPSTTSRPSFNGNGNKLGPIAGNHRPTFRSSTSLANISKPRVASSSNSPKPAPTQSLQRAPSNAKGTSKGKEAFNRVAYAKTDAEREKREKEETARKARAEAAERSRKLSREWAEKKKREKMGVKHAGRQSNGDASIISGH